jgi:DNA-binding NarL/FixJ family response regulator
MSAGSQGVRSVYLVEDSELLGARLRALLGEVEGVRVVGQAGGALEAIAAVGALRPDVVVLDLRLKQGSGFDVLHAIRQGGVDTRVIVLTNHGSVQYRRKALEAGADCFLDKSNDFDRLVDAVLGADCPPGSNSL